MGKGDKKSKKGKISMGSYGVNRPRKKRNNYRFVPHAKKESVGAAAKAEVVATTEDKAAKPKRKTAAKTAKK